MAVAWLAIFSKPLRESKKRNIGGGELMIPRRGKRLPSELTHTPITRIFSQMVRSDLRPIETIEE